MNKLLLSAAFLTVLSINIAEAGGAKAHSVHSKGIPVDKVDSAGVVKNHPEAVEVGCSGRYPC